MKNISHLNKINNENIKTSCALGFFDGLHLGHAEVIRSAIADANKFNLEPAVFTFQNNADSTALPKLSANENIISSDQKRALLKDIGVNIVYSPDFSEVRDLSPEEFINGILINKLNVASISCGDDFRFGKGGNGNPFLLKKLCEGKDIHTNIIPPVNFGGKVISSSSIRMLIKDGNVKRAGNLLGYQLMYDLPVLHGAKLARTLNAPTINQRIPDGNVIPRYGVYKSWAVINGKNYPSVTNIGIKPTVNETLPKPLMETYIIGYNGGELYGEIVRVLLRDFIRDEMKFNSIQELKKQIKLDVEHSLK